MSVHAPGRRRGSERGRDRVARRERGRVVGCMLTGYRSRRAREEGPSPPLPLVRAGITQLFNLKPPDSN